MASYLFLCLLLFFPHHYASSGSQYSCSSLIQFKNSFSITEDASLSCDHITGLKSYPKTNSWKEGTDCCSWDGVTCDHLNAHVISLDLSCSWLYGNFPSNTTLFLLPHLQKLNLAYNDFNLSKIPSEFGRFESLIYDYKQFTIDKHAVEGFVHNLTEVRHLFLDGMDMSSVNAYVFMNLSSSLRSLSLGGCDLQGKFPKNIFDLPNLNLLNLGDNQNLNLDPLKLNRSSNLEHLDLSSMSFSTEFIDSVDNLHALKYLDLSGNSFFQGISVSITNLSSLEYLDISGANIFGGLPDSMGNLVSLKFLVLYYSNLLGPVPRSLGNLLQLTRLDLSQNQLSGQIPRSLGNLLQLTHLDLSLNQLSGQIPRSLGNLLQLTHLDLSQNQLSGQIPRSLGKLSQLTHLDSQLTHLDLSQNQLSGPIPRSLGNLLQLTHLDLSQNQLSGQISLSILNLTHLEFLDITENSLEGSIPDELRRSKCFLISNNSFNGEVSSLICNVTSLQILDLSHNNLSGTIPQCFGRLSDSLQFLNLKKNKFYGTIPPTFAKGCQLSNFNLNGNLLEGPLTPSILTCKGLEVLDLGNNDINDTFPHWLGSLPELQVLVLKSNQLHGSLCVNNSKSSPFFSKIQIFDLSSNYFSGPLPVRYINSFKAIINLEKVGSTVSYMGVNDLGGRGFYAYSIGIVMKGQDMELVKIFTMWMIIDLSSNQFEGEIPKVIGKLNLLKGLNLSHNNLNGGIPTSVGDLTSLEWLDLSSNRLSGMIPNRLADLPFLSSLNVSENELHGQIPQGKQFNTFGNDSYEGNKELCGFPVSKGFNIIEPAPPNVLEKDGSKSNISFGWKVVLIGYGCGVVLGIFVGYVVFQTGKPKWLVNLVENQHEKRRRRKSKEGNRSSRRRRI
ncbi:receptor-like protein Cf-9 homolog [Gossypium hirsutum]|uniref:Receptor-like protein Cf-9 homolog n=1 Tax=Gossypium hirsutum TaxID=3635 RepID=A0ABM3A1P1_GOSHI|nr:receptor-like protein Cf-9 homolog [Gossypium hirsutum]